MAIDRLEVLFRSQEDFMRLLQRKRNFPEFPVDLTSKAGQKLVKQISYEAADELCEARQHLKNKDHRATHIAEIDKEAYLEELTDAAHYLVEIVIASGFTVDEFFAAYMKKHDKNCERIEGGY